MLVINECIAYTYMYAMLDTYTPLEHNPNVSDIYPSIYFNERLTVSSSSFCPIQNALLRNILEDVHVTITNHCVKDMYEYMVRMVNGTECYDG